MKRLEYAADIVPNARLETPEHIYLPCREKFSKIRHKNCHFFIKDGSICNICATYKSKTLWKLKARTEASNEPERKKMRVSADSHVPYSSLTREELLERMKNMHQEKREALRKISRLSNKISKSVFDEGIVTGEENH